MSKEIKSNHCGYYHDEDGICLNDSCRKSNPDCQDEWEVCETCNGKGYKAKNKEEADEDKRA